MDDPAYVIIRLELDSTDDANAFLGRLRQLWTDRGATPALRGTPQVRILDRVDRSPST